MSPFETIFVIVGGWGGVRRVILQAILLDLDVVIYWSILQIDL